MGLLDVVACWIAECYSMLDCYIGAIDVGFLAGLVATFIHWGHVGLPFSSLFYMENRVIGNLYKYTHMGRRESGRPINSRQALELEAR